MIRNLSKDKENQRRQVLIVAQKIGVTPIIGNDGYPVVEIVVESETIKNTTKKTDSTAKAPQKWEQLKLF